MSSKESDFPIPETKVLTIASHVVYGYVGNKMATFVMQALGCDVSAMNTVQFSNHTGYKQFKGTRSTAEEIKDLYTGLTQSHLNDFSMMLTGYCPNAAVVEAAGVIARDLKFNAAMQPGSFLWILDPVMGDNGRLYVDASVVPIYRGLIAHADLIVPNQFELETLSEIKVESLTQLQAAVERLHREHRTPHIVVTSVRLDGEGKGKLAVVGSTRTSEFRARLFRIDVPAFDVFFSGTGDLFAALMAVRLKEAALAAGVTHRASWMSPDEIESQDLPLAKAAEKVLASMHVVLEKTMQARETELERLEPRQQGDEPGATIEEGGKQRHLRLTKAAEVRVVRYVRDLKHPPDMFKATPLGTGTMPQMREKP